MAPPPDVGFARGVFTIGDGQFADIKPHPHGAEDEVEVAEVISVRGELQVTLTVLTGFNTHDSIGRGFKIRGIFYVTVLGKDH